MCGRVNICLRLICLCFFCFQAEDGIRDLVRSRGLGDVYKRQRLGYEHYWHAPQMLLFCDCGGSNGSRQYVFKEQLLSLIPI